MTLESFRISIPDLYIECNSLYICFGMDVKSYFTLQERRRR